MTNALANLSDAELQALYTKGQQPSNPLGGLTDDQLKQAYNRTQADKTTWTERGAMGLGDPVQGGAQLLTKILPQSVVDAGNRANDWLAEKTGLVEKMPQGGLDQMIAQREADYRARRGENADKFDPMRMTGNVAATLPVAAAFPGSILGAVGAGAATGALSPVENGQGDYWTEKAKQAAFGGAAGGVAAGIGKGLARIVSPNTSPEVQQLINKGVNPTPGQLVGGIAKKAEDLTGMGQQGVTREFNLAAINDALAPLGVKLPAGAVAGQDAVSAARNIVNSAYDDVWSGARNVKLDQEAKDALLKISTEASDKLKADQLSQYGALVKDALKDLTDTGGGMGADKVRAAVTAIRENADDFMRSGGGDRIVGRLLGRIGDTLEEAATRTNPALAAAKKAADTAYAGMTRIYDAASKDVAEGIFTPRQLAQSVRSGAGANATAQGKALLQDIAGAGMKVLSPGGGGMAGQAIPLALGAAGIGTSALTNDPTYGIAGAGLAGLYTPTGRRALATMLTQRPNQAKAIADAIRALGPYSAAGAGALANRMPQRQQAPIPLRIDSSGRTI